MGRVDGLLGRPCPVGQAYLCIVVLCSAGISILFFFFLFSVRCGVSERVAFVREMCLYWRGFFLLGWFGLAGCGFWVIDTISLLSYAY